MKTRLFACVVVLLAAFAYCQEPSAPGKGDKNSDRGGGRSKGAPWRQKWEYMVLKSTTIANQADGDLEASLNKLGNEAWELIAIRGGEGVGSKIDLYFKRAMSPVIRGVMGGGINSSREASGSFGGGFGGGGPGGIAKLDSPARRTLPLKLFRLKYGDATKLATILQQLFNETRLAGDPRTNSLLVSGPQEQIQKIEALVTALDQPATESSKK
jgi:hypothetical protein